MKRANTGKSQARSGKVRGRIHPAWLVFIGCLGFYSLVIGFLSNTAGNYYEPVMQETGWSRFEATIFTVIMPIVACACSPFSGKILNRFGPRTVLPACVIAFGIAYLLTAVTRGLWSWILFGVVYGATSSFIMYLAVPVLINAWFAKRMGLLIGIVGASLSVCAAIASPLTTFLIGLLGWRCARVVMGVTVTALACAITVACVRGMPDTLGVAPYGAEEDASCNTRKRDALRTRGARSDGAQPPQTVEARSEGVSAAQRASAHADARGVEASRAMRSPAFVLLLVSAGCFVMSATLCQQIASFGAESPHIGAVAGAFAVSIVSSVAIFAKIFLGWVSDRYGARVAARMGAGCGCMGALVMLCASGVPAFFLGAALFGCGYSALSVVNPLATKDCFGPRDYTRIYARVTTAVFFFNAIGASAYAVIYDVTGSYAGMFVMVIALYATAFLIVPLAISLGSKLWK
ncbi:MAG TPA: MFS transporter [Slackia equolifaciens]|uniref:MFS transporter n=1 Tax=Slackia equolifaciens TaxID=498718 RepID=A0A9D2UV41_9ACTN|nr:MFS transporter [Slackia equolifaciens]